MDITKPPTMSEKTMSAKPKTPREFYPKSGSYFLHSQKQDIFAFAAAYHAHELAAIRTEVDGKIVLFERLMASTDGDGNSLHENDIKDIASQVRGMQTCLDILDAHKPKP